MLALRLISFLLATRLSCVSALSGDEAKQRFAFLQGKALTLTTEANALSTISCLPSLPTFPPNPYDALATHVNDLRAEINNVSTSLTVVALTSDGTDVFDAYYDFSQQLRKFLATLATKACGGTGPVCSNVPLVRQNIRNAISSLKSDIMGISNNLMLFIPADQGWDRAITGVKEADGLFCDIVIASYGGVLNLN